MSDVTTLPAVPTTTNVAKAEVAIDYTGAKIIVEDRTNIETGEVFVDRIAIKLTTGRKIKLINKKVEVQAAMKDAGSKEKFFDKIVKDEGEYGTFYRIDNSKFKEELTFE